MLEISMLRAYAQAEGFGEVGICAAAGFETQRQIVAQQPILKERKQLRYFPTQDDEKIKSIVVLLWPYAQIAMSTGRNLFVDSYYEASNAAYHAAIQLERRLREAGVYAKANVAYPAKAAAMRAGMGVIGHHGLLIHPQFGSRVVIILMATDIICDEKDGAFHGECLNCGRCTAACPSGAIDEDGMSHPERCLRNFMMEGVVAPEHMRKVMGGRLLGCDMCQRVCPMQPTTECAQGSWTLDEFVTDDSAQFSKAIERLGQKIGKNAARPQRVRAQTALLCGNIGNKGDLPILAAWAKSDFAAVQEHAAWAIEQIEQKESLNAAGLDQIGKKGYNI